MTHRMMLATAYVVCLSSATLAQNWPQFRGGAGDGVASAAKHPEKWSAEENLAWKTKMPGVGWSQPIVWGDKVFLTAAVSERGQRPKPGDWSPGDAGVLTMVFGNYRKPPAAEYQWQLLCLDGKTGEIAWERTALTGKPRVPIHINNTYATETPATDGERIVAYFGMLGAFCYDMEGTLLWQKDLGSYPMQMDWGSGSSPLIVGDLVVIQCDNDKASFVVGLNKNNGDEVWREKRDERANWCTPVVWKNSRREELVVGGGTKMRSYEPATGKLLWEMAGSGRCSASPVAAGDLLFVNSGDRLTGQRGILAAIKAGASSDISLGGDAAANEHIAWHQEHVGHVVASPLVAADCLYLCEQKAGIIHCLDAKTGKRHYRQRLPGATGLTASPWTTGDKVFFLDQSGQTFVIAAGPTYKLLNTNKVADEMFWASAAVSGDAVLLRGVDHIFCVR